ncbi:major facilitator superfamily transporter glucose [Grosmannia clavigera kw1407]|uniref:Major facilitator superfamily transporter glucose n=1 Tax=Grosmannia clavigera (strain kw1407 / UAMH 11150) TaxID=655863 RepID=F0XS10_GROCL|nr:major facilitator superfamily transporter glucose [Grosmannia clavigera kw1407]EFW99610.1 major facilitator superfamily transporter glucose [Grosmannia clavigera kw1407]
MIGNIYLITAIAVIGGSLFGFDIASLSAILSTNQYRCYFNDGPRGPPFDDSVTCSGLTSLRQGGVTAAMSAGSWLGALASGLVTERFGRKRAIMLGCIIWCVGSAIICASQAVAMLIVGRIINGLAVGIESSQVPVYVSELSQPSLRGRLVAAQQWAITWGILIMFYISYGCSFIGGDPSTATNPAAFRIPWALQMLPAIGLFFGMMPLPESPSAGLASHGRWAECSAVLTLVHGKGDPDSVFARAELAEIRAVVEFEARNRDATYWELFRSNMLHRTLIGLFCQIWSQLTGMNVMMYYISYIFAMTGYSGNANLLASSIQYVINVLMTVPALLWIDRYGRRNAMLVGAGLMMVWMYANGAIMRTYGTVVPGGIDGVAAESMVVGGPAGKAVIACTYLFVASYAPTWGPASWIYPPELFPLRLRGLGVSLATSGNWAFNTALGLFTPIAFQNIMWKTYILFGVFGTCMFLHVFFLFPETAGKTLEGTQAMFEDPAGIRHIGTPAWKTRVQYSKATGLETGNIDPEKLAALGLRTKAEVPEVEHHQGMEE